MRFECTCAFCTAAARWCTDSLHDNGDCTTEAVNQMHTWCKASTSSLGCPHTCMPAQGIVNPLIIIHTRKHCLSHLHSRQPKRTFRNLQRIFAVEKEQHTETNDETKQQAGARTCEGRRPQLMSPACNLRVDFQVRPRPMKTLKSPS